MAKDTLDNDELATLTKEEIGELAEFLDPDVSHDLCTRELN